MKKIKTVGVIGAGTMGAAIAQKFAQEGFTVFLNDREQQYIDKGMSGIRSILEQGVARRLFTQEKVENIIGNIKGTTDQQDLKVCDLIVEAIFEDFDVKSQLFKTLDKIVPADTIIATNTSSFSVTELSASVSHPERFIGLHYFFHAAKNRLVEIIPGAKTSAGTYTSVQAFSVQSGKDAITTKDANGFAVNRFFVPWLNESCKMLEEGIGTIAEIDTVCMKIFGIGMGPFALMNATGVPIALHAQKTLVHFGPSYEIAAILEKQVASGQEWDLSEMQEAKINTPKEKTITERILGCTFFVCSQLLAEAVCTATDLNRGAKIGLRWRKGPVDLMQKFGEDEVQKMTKIYAEMYGEKIPKGIKAENWQMQFVTLEFNQNRAIITMSRPEDMNALNEEVMAQLDAKFSEADSRSDIDTIILTGSGKAFVAGADIKFFVKNIKSEHIDNIVSFTKYGQEVLNKIAHSSKKTIAILNGLALGGGLELALCADVLLAVPKAKIGFPETGIGIYPGLGGTQRSATKIGKGLAKYMVLTGQMLGANQAMEIGLIDAVVLPSEVFEIMAGEKAVPAIAKVALSDRWKAIESLYDNHKYKTIMSNDGVDLGIEEKVLAKLAKTMGYKAPMAMAIAEKLIDEAKGCQSELDQLTTIFESSDALLGLSSVGQKVLYQGK